MSRSPAWTSSRARLLRLLSEVRDRWRIPMLYISHNRDEIAFLADQVMTIDDGRLASPIPVASFLLQADQADLADQVADMQQPQMVVRCQVADYNAQTHVATLQFPGGHLRCVSPQPIADAELRVLIDAKDVSVSAQAPSPSSILNILPVYLEDIRPYKTGRSLLTLRCNQQRILSEISHYSLEKLGLHIGQECYAQIKAVALSVAG